jgi:hypothetical protein
MAAFRQQKRPGARRTGRQRQPLTGRTVQLSSPARDVRPGHRYPGRSLRPPRERDSIQRSSALTGYGQWAASPNRGDRAWPPPGAGSVMIVHGYCLSRGCRYCLRGCRIAGSRPSSPSATQSSRPHPDRAAPGPPPPVAAFPQAPSAPAKAPPRFSERDSLPERFIRESRSLNFTPSTPAQIGWKWVECTGLGSRGRVGREQRAAGPGIRGRPRCAQGQAVASASSSVKPRVLLGSTGMPGPIVVVNVTFFRYRPLAAAGLSLITSSRAAA